MHDVFYAAKKTWMQLLLIGGGLEMTAGMPKSGGASRRSRSSSFLPSLQVAWVALGSFLSVVGVSHLLEPLNK